MIKARIGRAKPVVGKVAVPVDFFDDAAPTIVIDSDTYLVTWDANSITTLTALVTEGINARRAAATGVASFNTNVPDGTIIG